MPAHLYLITTKRDFYSQQKFDKRLCFKMQFYYYSQMVKLTDQEMTTIEMKVCYSHYPREETPAPRTDTTGSPRVGQGQRKQGGNVVLWFSREKTCEAE